LKYTFDIFNLTNTSSFDIPIDDVSQNAVLQQFPERGERLLTHGLWDLQRGERFLQLSVGLVTNKTIGSPRQIQMTLRVLF
jgi:hypothetical protein